QRSPAVGVFEAENRGDVRMMELGEKLRLALETPQPLRVPGEGSGQHLDRHLSLQPRVGGPPNLTHAALAELGGDLVGAETGADPRLAQPPAPPAPRTFCSSGSQLRTTCKGPDPGTRRRKMKRPSGVTS